MNNFSKNYLLFLVFYFPIEEFIIKWINVNDYVYLLIRQVPDFLLFFLIALKFIELTIIKRSKLKTFSKKIDIILLFFVLFNIFSFVFNNTNYFSHLLQVKALLRYISVLYLLYNINIDNIYVVRFVKVFMLALFLQSIICFFQLYGVNDFFTPRIIDKDIYGQTVMTTVYKEVEKGWVSGTMQNNINCGLFFLIGFVLMYISLYNKDLIIKNTTLIIIFFLVYYTGSRICLIACLFSIFYIELIKKKYLKFTIYLATFCFLSMLILSLSNNLLFYRDSLFYIFTQDYHSEALGQRLGILLIVLPFFILNSGFSLLIGLGPDQDKIDLFLSNLNELPVLLAKTSAPIEDIYFVALLFYYGLIGLFLFIYFLRQVYKITKDLRKESYLFSDLATVSSVLIVISVMLNFINQAYEIRQFSFYLWFITGLVIAINSGKNASSIDTQ